MEMVSIFFSVIKDMFFEIIAEGLWGWTCSLQIFNAILRSVFSGAA